MAANTATVASEAKPMMPMVSNVRSTLTSVPKIRHGKPTLVTRRVTKAVSKGTPFFAQAKPIPAHRNTGAMIEKISANMS